MCASLLPVLSEYLSGVGFYLHGCRQVVVERSRVLPGDAQYAVEPYLAAQNVARLADDDEFAWSGLVRMFERIHGPLNGARPDLSKRQAACEGLERALEAGDLVLLREPRPRVEIRVPRPRPPAPAEPRPAKVIREKSFVDITVVDGDGTPLAGAKYKLQVPDGRTETGALGGTGQVYEGNLDPGTAFFTLVKDVGDPVPGEDPEPDAPTVYVSFHVIDQDGDPLPGVRYEIALPDGTSQTGTTDDAGGVFLSNVAAGACQLSLPDLPDDSWDLGGQ
jgi:hypothetical protein